MNAPPSARPAIAPGEVLTNELVARGWSVARLATLIGYEAPMLWRVLAGSERIDECLAVALSDALGTSDLIWLNLQANYDRDRGNV